ncbi:nudix hydrolase 17, mitochondrial-like, partial [Mangifera indica]|uniref:nudix hydrolase 17, mitochondrial-like n=1 Tax=Mangifera indica TaxID=29780 RepID=UPI001CFBDD01
MAVSLASRMGRKLQRYNNLGHRQVVGCIPYRFKNGADVDITDELEVLVVTSQKGRAQGLMFPKGGWEVDESLEQAALRESIEEAGVLGNVERELGKWNFVSKSQGTLYEGYMFPLLVKEQLEVWPEKDVRQRIWMSIDEAREVCCHWWMKEALDIFVEKNESFSQQKEEEE